MSREFNNPGNPKLTEMEKLILDRLRAIPVYPQARVIAFIHNEYEKLNEKPLAQPKHTGKIITLPNLKNERLPLYPR